MIWIFCAIISNCAASLLMKFTAIQEKTLWQKAPLLALAMIAYVGSFVFYYKALEKLPVQQSYPLVTAGTSVLLLAIAPFLFKDNLTVMHYMGAGCIVLGFVLFLKAG